MKRLNVRAYGLWIHDGAVLVTEEKIRDLLVVKFPGGGLEMGEGLRDCLVREWKEELDLDITVGEHFYTTDFYQPSAFDASQVISVYYRIHGEAPKELRNLVPGERSFWMPLRDVHEDAFTLPIDKVVGGMIRRDFLAGKLWLNSSSPTQ